MVTQGVWDLVQSTPYKEMPEEEQHENDNHKQDVTSESRLPGCSKGQDHGHQWTMSTSMVQTYFTMRGPGASIDDPLVDWTKKQDKKNLKDGDSGLLDEIYKSIYEERDWKVQGPARFDEEDDVQATFQYNRPQIDPIKLPESLDPNELQEIREAQKEASDGWHKYAASEVSDDEGDPTDGRISPCTFARWAEGAQRWDEPSDKYRSKWELRVTFDIPEDRQRPPSPNTQIPREPKRRERKRLIDRNDGRPLSPACSEYAKSQPSILWSPPPMKAALPSDFWTRKMDRMDPELAKALREGVTSTVPSFGLGPDEQVPEVFSRSEVDQAIERYWGLNHTHGLLAERYEDLGYLRYNEEQVNAANERYRHDIRRLKHENRKLDDCLELWREKREKLIMRSVYQHIRDLDYENMAKLAEIKARWKENAELQDDYETMKDLQHRLLEEFGKETPEEVFEMFPNVWKSLEERKNRRNFS